MSLSLKWSIVKKLDDKLRKNLKDDSILIFEVQPIKGPIQKKKVRMSDFQRMFWSLYDDNKYISKITIYNQPDKKVLYSYERSTNQTIHPKSGNPLNIQNWKSFSDIKKVALLKILESQILNAF